MELLETLLLFFREPTREWDAPSLASQLRSNTDSTARNLTTLMARGFICEISASHYVFCSTNEADNKTIAEVAELYSTYRHRIYELIFSPAKKARDFSEAFRRKKGSDHG